MRTGEAAHVHPLRGRHGDGPVHRQEHRCDPCRDHRRFAGADRHGADLPDAGRAGGRHRGHDAAALPGHGRTSGQAGRGLHDRPLRRAAGTSAAGRQSRHGHRQPRRVADRQVDAGTRQTEPVVRPFRRLVRDHAAVRRDVESGRRLAAGIAGRRQRRGAVRRTGSAGANWCNAAGPTAPR